MHQLPMSLSSQGPRTNGPYANAQSLQEVIERVLAETEKNFNFRFMIQ